MRAQEPGREGSLLRGESQPTPPPHNDAFMEAAPHEALALRGVRVAKGATPEESRAMSIGFTTAVCTLFVLEV